MQYVYLAFIGIGAGLLSGLVGVGGGIILVPGLVLLLGYSQLQAQGTSLGVLVLPVVLLGFLQYYRNPELNISIPAILIIAAFFVVGAFVSARLANYVLDPAIIRKGFALLLAFTAVQMFLKR
jgi:uncharacterized protein